MTEAVSNTSPLIVLAKAELLEILPKLFSRILVPQAVINEIQAGHADDPIRRALPNCPWLATVRLAPAISPLSTWPLGRGEAEVIEYARVNGTPSVLLDDRAGRRAAESLGLKVYGTLSLAAMAVRQGHVDSFDTAYQKLKSAGLYVSDDVVEAVRKTLK